MPAAGMVIRLAEALGVSRNGLFQEAGLRPRELAGEDEVGFSELWGIMKRMSVEGRREVIRYALFRDSGTRQGGRR